MKLLENKLHFFKKYIYVVYIILPLVFFPSYSLVQQISISAPPHLPKQSTAGSMVVLSLKQLKEIPDILTLGHYEFSKSQKGFFAGVGINVSKTLNIHGIFLKSESLHSMLNDLLLPSSIHPRHYWFSSKVNIQKANLEDAIQIKLPKNIWLKVDDKYALQKHADKVLLSNIFSTSKDDLEFDCWHRPVKGKEVSKFGSPRILPNGEKYFHSGVDYRAMIGTAVKSAGSGKVVFVDQTVVGGKTVIVDHGQGVFTSYLHLNEYLVKVEDKVKTKMVIAKSGATGRVEAPHLHFDIIWRGNYVEPGRFLEMWEQICDRG